MTRGWLNARLKHIFTVYTLNFFSFKFAIFLALSLIYTRRIFRATRIFRHKFFACEFAANSKFNFHWQNFFCEFAVNNAKENGVCSKIVVIKKAYNLKANSVEKASKKAKKAVLGSKNLFRTSVEGGVSSFGKGLTLT